MLGKWTLRDMKRRVRSVCMCVCSQREWERGSGLYWLIQTLCECVSRAMGTEYSAGSTVHPGGEAPA